MLKNLLLIRGGLEDDQEDLINRLESEVKEPLKSLKTWNSEIVVIKKLPEKTLKALVEIYHFIICLKEKRTGWWRVSAATMMEKFTKYVNYLRDNLEKERKSNYENHP